MGIIQMIYIGLMGLFGRAIAEHIQGCGTEERSELSLDFSGLVTPQHPHKTRFALLTSLIQNPG